MTEYYVFCVSSDLWSSRWIRTSASRPATSYAGTWRDNTVITKTTLRWTFSSIQSFKFILTWIRSTSRTRSDYLSSLEMRDPPPTSGTSRSPWLTARETRRFKVIFLHLHFPCNHISISKLPRDVGSITTHSQDHSSLSILGKREKWRNNFWDEKKYPFSLDLVQARPILQTQTMQSASDLGQSYFCSSLPEYYRLIIYLSGRDIAVSSSQRRSGTLSWTATWWGTWWSRGRARSVTRSGVTAPSSLTRTPAGTTSRWQTVL